MQDTAKKAPKGAPLPCQGCFFDPENCARAQAAAPFAPRCPLAWRPRQGRPAPWMQQPQAEPTPRPTLS